MNEGPSHDDMDAEEQAIRSLFDRWHDAIEAEDISALLGMLTEDAMILALGTPTITGHAAIRSMYESTFPLYSIEQKLTIRQWEAGPQLAVVCGEEDFKVVPKDPKNAAHSWPGIRTLTVLRRVDGEWKIARAMSNEPSSLEKAAASS